MENAEFCNLMRMSNNRLSELLNHVLSHLLYPNENSLQLFLTGSADCGCY